MEGKKEGRSEGGRREGGRREGMGEEQKAGKEGREYATIKITHIRMVDYPFFHF